MNLFSNVRPDFTVIGHRSLSRMNLVKLAITRPLLLSLAALGITAVAVAQGPHTAVRLNGIDARGSGPGVGNLVSDSTWEAWVRIPQYDPTTSIGLVLSRWGAWTSAAPVINTGNGACTGCLGYANPGEWAPGAPAGTVAAGGWHHIATVFGSGAAPGWRMYVDGQLVESTPPGGYVTAGGWETDLGCWGYIGYGGFLHADVDEARLSNIPRYNANFTPAQFFTPDVNTVALWHFDEGAGNIAFDASGNGVDLTLFGGYSWANGVPRPPFTPYCNAKLNSQGCLPLIAADGSVSLGGPDDLTISASNVIPNRPGIMLWGTTTASTPFFGGTLCITPPITRTCIQNSGNVGGACGGNYSYPFTHAYMANSFLQPGIQVCVQYYSRDPGFTAPNSVGLTDAIKFNLAP